MKKSLALLAVAPLVALLAACGTDAKSDDTVSVVVSFYPYAYIVEEVGGPFVNVTNLTTPGVEAHDLELKPKQVGAVQDADLLVYQSGFQPAVDEAVKQSGRSASKTLDAASVVQLKPGTQDEHAEEGHEEEGHEEHAEEGHSADDGHDHGAEDPHLWLDPTNMAAVTKAVADQLSKADPEHAADYKAQAERLSADLDLLDESFTEGLKNCRTRTIVTSHAAFQYLAARYDLEQIAIAGIDPSNEPSPSQLAEITQLVRKAKISTIFTEELVSPAIANTIADETGTTTAVLDPIEGLSDTTKDETYATLMRKNLETLQKANSCE